MIKFNITEITVYHDLIVNNSGNTRLLEIGVDDDTVFEECPKECSQCKSKDILGLEICDHLHLRLDKTKTEKLLENSTKLWSNPNDWTLPDKKDYI